MNDIEIASTNKSNSLSADQSDITLKVDAISKNFGQLTAVNNLSFEVRKGEIVGFLGPNGAGKSTTMKMLTSFYTPDSGTLTVNGTDTQEDDIETRRSIGYLPENNPLYGDLLVKEYLSFVADLRSMPHNIRKENTERTVAETGLEEVFYRPINQLSKGYRQRVGLAQAILHRPSILIMDEPTEGLDPNQRITIRELIRNLGKERTVMLSTHVMQEVEASCERVLMISRGKLVADSTVPDLLKGSHLARTIHMEVDGQGVESALSKINGIEKITSEESESPRKRYSIYTSTEKELRPELFQLAKSENWTLWELYEETANLEDIFHNLTSDTGR